MISSAPILALFGLLAATANASSYHDASAAFAFSTRRIRPSSSSSRLMPKLRMAPPSKTKSTVAEIEADSDQLRKEIKLLREEALLRLESLQEQLSVSGISSSSVPIANVKASDTADDGLLAAPMPIAFTETKSKKASTKKKSMKGIANLLDETRWKVTLSIGREPGTWMPKEWSKDGQRLNVSFDVEFTPSQLFERDDFLRGGYANAKVLHVIENEIKLGPSISEGQRVYKVKDGGWQVTKGDGPMGTDLLRFYIEVDEKIEHTDGDVYVPKGRVYSSCGYFPFLGYGKASSIKAAFTKELRRVEDNILKLQEAKDEIRNPFNFDGIQMSREIYKLRREAEEINNKLNFMMVKEPDKRLLKFSKGGDVGLTKEGGVCCQVNKGPVVEYHILGRFSIAAAVEHD